MAQIYTDFNAAMKEFNAENLSDVGIFKLNPLLEFLTPKEMGGTDIKIPLRTSPPPGISATFSVAQTQSRAYSTSYKAFKVTHKECHQVVTMPVSAILGSNSDKKAFVELLANAQEGGRAHVAQALEVQLFRDGWGELGQVESIGATYVVLTKATDVWHFNENYRIVAAAAKATGNIRAESSAGSRVTAVDPNTARVYFSADPTDGTNGISTALAPGDYLFRKGDRDEASSPAKLCTEGLLSWLPGTDPADTFYDVVRTGNVRLYGNFLDASAMTFQQALVEADRIVSTAGGTLDTVFSHPLTFARMKIELMSEQWREPGGNADVSFSGITILGQQGQKIHVKPSRGCQVDKLWGLDSSTWSLRLLTGKEKVQIDSEDGNTVLRGATAKDVEQRIHFMGNLVCDAPSFNINITAPTN
jgi:hypothetical protein